MGLITNIPGVGVRGGGWVWVGWVEIIMINALLSSTGLELELSLAIENISFLIK